MGDTKFPHTKTLWLLPLAFFLFSFASPAFAQFWKKKDYHHWSARDCQKILTDSPWTQSYSAGVIRYTAQFFSARPVREAQVRLAQIESHYNRMSPAQKSAFDQHAAHYISFRYPKYTVIRVSYSANVDTYDQASLDEIQRRLQGYWQSMAAPKFRNSVFLSVDGKAVRVAQYKFAPEKEQAFFLFFPRQMNGKPLLDSSRKSLTLQITNPSLQFDNGFSPQNSFTANPAPAGDIEMGFKVKKMVFDGKIAY